MTEKHNRITKYNPEVKEDRQQEKGGKERESERGGGGGPFHGQLEKSIIFDAQKNTCCN